MQFNYYVGYFFAVSGRLIVIVEPIKSDTVTPSPLSGEDINLMYPPQVYETTLLVSCVYYLYNFFVFLL